MSRLTKIFLILFILGGCAWHQYLIDDGMGISWPQNVLRNWQESGFFTLHGKLVTNPGGFQAVTHPDVYTGMSPIFLYPVYGVTQIFAWTGLGVVPFQMLLALAVFWAVWDLLGRNQFSFFVAAVSVGMVGGKALLDLDYSEDSGCDTDMNVVMTGSGGLVEVQGTAEGEPFTRQQMDRLLDLATRGIGDIIARQREVLSGATT